MLEAASCSALHVAENPIVEYAALQRLNALLDGAVVQDRHSSLGGPMQIRRTRLGDPQLQLFLDQSEVIDWSILYHQTQPEAIRLLTKLLREHSATQLRRTREAEGSHE